VVLAGGPLGTSSPRLLARSRLDGGLAGRLGVAAAVGALPGMNPLDGGAGPLSVGPLDGVARVGAEGPLQIGDLVGAPVVLDRGRGLAPGPLAPGGLRYRAQGVQDITRPVGLDRVPMATLVRPRQGKIIAGVCAGLARRFGISVTLIRVAFVVFAVTGVGELVYLILWVVMPKAPE
jgi:phage shock protein C